MQFFLPMRPPTVTHHDKDLHAFMRGGKPCAVLHDSRELKDARAKLHAALAPFAPDKPFGGPVRLLVKWCFPSDGRHADGEWKTTKPDTDNLDKALKDEMTRLRYPGGAGGDGRHLCLIRIMRFCTRLQRRFFMPTLAA